MSASICVCVAFEIVLMLTRKKKIRMSCVGDAFERAQVQVRYESIFDSLLVW